MKFRKNWKRFWTLNRHHAEGFTLVELIVVIAILAILGGVAVPAYSGYVAKAERAGDEQLLAAVNQAFASACAVNGTDNYKVGKAYANLADGKVDAVYVTAAGDAYDQAFDTFFAGNEESAFKVYKGLFFNPELGIFQENTKEAYLKLLEKFLAGDIDNVNLSIFGDIGADGLMGKVANVSNIAAALFGTGESETIDTFLNDSLYAFAAMMGIDPSTEEGEAKFTAMFDNLALQKMEMLVKENPAYAGLDPATIIALSNGTDTSGRVMTPEEEELLLAANSQIMANSTVLNAAKNSSSLSLDVLKASGNSTAKSNLKGAIEDDSGDGLAKVAMAYGLYTAYAERNGLTVSDDYLTVLNSLDSEGFQTYLNSEEAATDLKGYQSSMNMVSSSTSDKDAISNMVVEGFDDPALIAVLQQALGQS